MHYMEKLNWRGAREGGSDITWPGLLVKVHAWSSAAHPSGPWAIDLLSLVVVEKDEGSTDTYLTFCERSIWTGLK